MGKTKKKMTQKGRNINAVVGRNIRSERKKRNIGVDTLAEILGLSAPFIGLLERGERGTTLENLVRFCEVFDITLNDLTNDDSPNDALIAAEPEPKNEKSEEDENKSKHQAIKTLLYDMSKEELDFVIAMLTNFKHFSGTKRK